MMDFVKMCLKSLLLQEQMILWGKGKINAMDRTQVHGTKCTL